MAKIRLWATSDDMDHLHAACHKRGKQAKVDKATLERIEVVPAPFDWSKVDPGMAFLRHNRSNDIVYYVGPDPWNNDYVIVTKDKKYIHNDSLTVPAKKILTRYPEGDA